jgi:NAD-dependent SIR2 family protein deacetylase
MRDKGLAPRAGTPVAVARPSYTHLALKALVDAGVCRAIISQNTDGLHARSGVPLDTLLELHGNSYKAVCWTCGFRQLYRQQVRKSGKAAGTCASEFDFGRSTSTDPCVHACLCALPAVGCLKRVPHFCHCTPHSCPKCGPSTPLRDTIIHFRENLEESILSAAESWGRRADVCLALGSSLTVTPAAGIPESVAVGGGKLVIVNKQDTPLDSLAALRVQASVDDVMAAVMRNLGIAVAPWDEGAFWASHAEESIATTPAASDPEVRAGAGTRAKPTLRSSGSSQSTTPAPQHKAGTARKASAATEAVTESSGSRLQSSADSVQALAAEYAALGLVTTSPAGRHK